MVFKNNLVNIIVVNTTIASLGTRSGGMISRTSSVNSGTGLLYQRPRLLTHFGFHNRGNSDSMRALERGAARWVERLGFYGLI